MRKSILAFGAIGIVAIAVGVVSQAGHSPASARGLTGPPPAPVVVELFTSQGCSSCPPADALVTALAGEPGVLALSRPVTYWDRLGWKDTLASPSNTELQRAYARHGFDGNGVYTPQVVVDGRAGAVGSQERAIRGLIASAGWAAKPGLSLTRAAGTATVAVDGGKGQGEVVLLALQPRVTVGIGSGENGGRKVTYTNVVRSERKLGTWAGGKQTFAIPADLAKAGAGRGYAVLVREPGGGRILAGRALLL